MAIINMGILFIAYKKFWKPLYFVSFGVTWLIFYSWYLFNYNTLLHYNIALVFATIFYLIFYFIFLAYKLFKSEAFTISSIILLLSNSFVYFGLGYLILNTNTQGQKLLGVFTIANAFMHLCISLLIYNRKLADKNLFHLIAGLFLIFITIAIPVQLNGSWVTLLWAFEATLLFYIGKTKNVAAYETLAYPLMFLAFLSLLQDWFMQNYFSYLEDSNKITPFLNINFLTAALFIASFVFINYINNKKIKTVNYIPSLFTPIITIAIPSILIFVGYFAFRNEIALYFTNAYYQTSKTILENGNNTPYTFTINNENINYFKSIWIINYSLLFFSIMGILNIKILKIKTVALINIALLSVFTLVFFTEGLNILSALRNNYLSPNNNPYFTNGPLNLFTRYFCYVFLGIAFYTIHLNLKQAFLQPLSKAIKITFECLFYLSLLWIISSELMAILEITKVTNTNKLGLSILWGCYALLLICIGIYKNKQYLRIGAIALFGITLLKLFIYDIAALNTIAKTILFVSLGILLLIISFLYNRFKDVIIEKPHE